MCSKPLQPADPIGYFMDLGLYHKKKFIDAMRSPAETFVSKLPELDACYVGKALTMERFNNEFEGDHQTWAHDALKALEGELLIFGAGFSRLVFTLMVVCGLLIFPISDPLVEPGITALVNMFSTGIEGAILALLYWSNSKFSRS